MGKIGEVVKKASSAVSVGTGLYELAVNVTGKPIRERTEPATIRIFGLPIFERDSNLDRYWFGFIPRGKSAVAKQSIAAKGGPGK